MASYLAFQAQRWQLAEAISATRSAIERWEYGRRPIPAWGEKLLKCLMMAKLAEQKLGLKL
jgi:hypothetical protein